MVDDRGSPKPLDDDTPKPDVEVEGSSAWSALDFDSTEEGRGDVSRPTKRIRLAPVAGALTGAAALGTAFGALRRRRSRAQASKRRGRRKRTAGALGAGGLGALLGARRARPARRSK